MNANRAPRLYLCLTSQLMISSDLAISRSHQMIEMQIVTDKSSRPVQCAAKIVFRLHLNQSG